jgi:6-phosphogluconolactonase
MTYFAFVSLQDDDKILVFTIGAGTGKLTQTGEAAVSGGPAALAISPDRNFLYVGRRGALDIASFSIDQATGGITQIGSAPLQGEPVALATDRKGRYVLSAYYYQRTAAVHRIENGAAVTPAVEWLMTASGAHSIQTDPSNRFAFVPHIANRGPNQIYQFKFDEDTGHLTPNSPPRVEPTEHLGPRHFCFHPSLDILYFTDEQGCSVTAYRLDTGAGTLQAFQTISTLPKGYSDSNSCSQIQITPNGKFLYAPNRGHNSIAGFSVDPSTGTLSAAGHAATQAVPRAFNLDPQGKFVYAAGLETGNLTSYVIDQATGELTPSEIYPVGKRPMWVLTTELGS